MVGPLGPGKRVPFFGWNPPPLKLKPPEDREGALAEITQTH